jgi:uncharacterized protein (TIGR02217 family)
MALTILSNVIAPNSLWEAGLSGKNMRRNRRAQAQGGAKRINILWSNTLRQYQFGTVPLPVSIWQTLEGLHEVTEGGAYGFLVQDPKDCQVDDTNGLVTLISGTNYQLIQRKTSAGSALYKDRAIRRPKPIGFVLKINGTPTLSYTLDEETGIVTIPSAPAASAVTWSGVFYVPVHFTSDDLDWVLQRAGPASLRLMAGPSVILEEVRE